MDSTEEPPSSELDTDYRTGVGTRLFGNTSIRLKVIWITLVPLIAMFLFSGIVARSVLDEAQTASKIQDFARLGNESSSLVDVLQIERSSAAAYVTDPGKTPSHPTLKHFVEQGRNTDAGFRRFLDQYESLDPEIAAPISSEFEQVKRGYAVMTRNRDSVIDQARKGGVRVGAAVTIYEQLITSLLQMKERLAGAAAGDEQLSAQLTAVSAFAKYKEAIWQEQIVVRTALEDGNKRFTNDTFGSFRAAVSDESAFRSQFMLSATDRQQQIRNTTLTEELTYQQLRTRAQNAGLGNALSFGLATWLETSDRENTLLRSIEQQLNTATVQDAGSFRTDAMQQAIIVITIALVALVVALLVSLAVARSMVRPLVRLRTSALEVAYQSLPDVVRKLQDADQQTAAQASAETAAKTVDIRSGDEIGQVAQAFNAVHLEAVRVASEQAQLRQSVSSMFVNLSRRSQLLVDRLIRLIDGLEQGEQDPDRLSELFKLDHLATRMRRNDENLLVLGGAESGRSWAKPAPLIDVLRAATAEVEQYTRVKLGSIDEGAEIAAGAVNDVVHLVAEILENATSFSSPRTDVTVDARREAGQVVIEVIDHGIGMSRQQLAEFNERLAKPPVFDIAVSRMMGLFVVGRLASRHGVKVMLRDATGGGVLVMITLPSGVLHVPAPASDASRVSRADVGNRPIERVASERLDLPKREPFNGFATKATASTYAPTSGFGNWASPAPVSPAPASTSPYTRTADSWSAFDPPTVRNVPPAPAPAPSEPSWSEATQPISVFPEPTVEMPLPIFEATNSDWFRTNPNLPRVPEAPGAYAPASDPASVRAEYSAAGRSSTTDPASVRAEYSAAGRSSTTDPASVLDSAPAPAPAFPFTPAAAPAPWPARGPRPPAGARPASALPPVAVPSLAASAVSARSSVATASRTPAPPSVPTPMAGPAEPAPAPAVSWESPADSGWKAAQAAAEKAPTALTDSGLPKRVPMAHYVPGRVERAPKLAPTQRSPEAIRGVLSSYRSGLEQGRLQSTKEEQ
ncbi:nitrate- and nitrite sensing domain-containing protein [Cryptosporangium phraense]|uniref:nitrate- and nitrite sensing domain-containing protein n=1 Tax=Cryptosporangium phraense TaxID=2593070 RepID=UPI0014788944|nr:nitrate- and nitrite sensing domain-containing protein [Cryptosporangium phraense]